MAPAPCSEARCPKTLDVGLALLAVGMAWWSRAHASEQSPAERGRYGFAAKARRAGLWAERNPVPPLQWPGRIRAPGENAGSADRLLPAAGDQPAPRAAAPSGRASTRSMRLPSIAVISKLQSAQSMRSPSSGRWPETKISKPATVL